MFEVGIVSSFEAAHRLRGDFGPATRLHGHTYRVEVSVRGPALRGDGTLLDVSELEGIVRDCVDELHYRDLDEVAAFQGHNTTAEVVAHHLFSWIALRLAGHGLSSLSVRVWESPRVFAAYDSALE